MNRSRALGAVGVLMLGQACGGAPPPDPIIKPPPLVITAAPPPAPVRAKWVFSDHSRSLAGKMDLGKDAGMLYVGEHGRRELVKGDADPVDAPTLALDDLVGVLKDDKGQYAFVADDGDVYVGKDPMGTLDTTRPGPLADIKGARLRSTTTGKAAIMGIASNDSRVLRTTDFGATWKPVDYAGGTKPYGKPISVALDSKGNGILIHVPQRVFVTHDDGATWAPIASPGIGARRVWRDGADRIFLEGFNWQRAKLDANALVVTSDEPEAIYKPAPKKTPDDAKSPTASDDEETDTVSVLAGDHLVQLANVYRHGKNREVHIRSSKLGEKSDKVITNTDLMSKDGLSHHVAGWNGTLLYLRSDDDSDENAPTSTVFLSNDYGATWTKDITIEGSDPQSDGVDVLVGPKGWAFIGALCANGESYGGGDDDEGGGGGAQNCGTRKIRPASATAFEDMAFTEDFVPASFYFDEAHDKVYALGNVPSSNEQRLYESAMSQNKFVRNKMDLAGNEVKAISVDSKGVLRAFTYDYKDGWTVVRRDADGKDLPKEYLPLDNGDLTFAGAHGLLLAGHNRGWETADGGATWIRVATNGSRSADCTDAGCRSGDAVRIGWDLPAAAKEENISATATPAPKPKDAPTPPATTPSPPAADLACKTSGAPSNLWATPSFDLSDNRADVRWAQIKHEDDQKVSLVVGGKTSIREVPLLAALPKRPPPAKGAKPDTMEYRSGDRTLTDGVVAARYSFQSKSSTGTFNPVDVDLTWFSFSTGKVGHHLLAKQKPFRVSSYGLTGDAQIVTGGLLYQALDQEPASFIHDDGKVEPLPLPPRASVRNALHVGTRWILGDAESGTTQIAWSDDNGKTWTTRAWTLDESGSSIGLMVLGGKPTVSLSRGGSPLALFGIDTTVPPEPPAPVVMDVNGSINNVCDASPGPLRLNMYIQYNQRAFKAHIDNGKKPASNLASSSRITHGLATGKACTASYMLYSNDETAFVYPDGANWAGWRFRRNDDPKKSSMLAEPISCK